MSFFDQLQAATTSERDVLLAQPLFADALNGRVTVPLYIAFLTQAYHHVKHTVPLMMACGARLGDDREWLRAKIVSYIEEEYGHHEWVLHDIRASGGDAERARHSEPAYETELMVAYAYNLIERGNPVGFFGMVHVLEGTSTALATQAAERIAIALRLPPTAFSYLSSHGSLDLSHVEFFRELIERLSPHDALALSDQGATVLLSGRRTVTLDDLSNAIANSGGRPLILPCDLSLPGAAKKLIDSARGGSIDAVINCAGVSWFGLFENQPDDDLQRLWQTNVLAPMQVVQAVLPLLKAQKHGLIVNVGSIFGSLGFPCFTSYSASKFALRGFSEALRRELHGTGVDVLYVAPRYTRTAINSGAVSRMAEAVAMKQDEPQAVAEAIVNAILDNSRERYFGWPERFFVRLNALLPRLVDQGLRSQNQRMRPFATVAARSVP